VAIPIALAIAVEFWAKAIAELINNASAPISIAKAASLGAPIPASTTTGTLALSIIMAKIMMIKLIKWYCR
jgi:hypothetical protein